jgi:hypothetical protein
VEVNITKFVRAYRSSMSQFSDSIARSSLQNIGQITWRNTLEVATASPRQLTDDLSALRNHFAEYGAWGREELEAMSGAELNALLMQFIAGDWQERERARRRGKAALREYEENGGGRLYWSRGRWFYYVGC